MNNPRIKCPHCVRTFLDTNAVYSHIKAKHGGKGKAAFAPENQPGYEPSEAELQIEREQYNWRKK